MIRKIALTVLMAVTVSACATNKVAKTQQSYAEAEFTILEITIDNAVSPKANREFIQLMRKSTEVARKAYNSEAGNDRATYNLELSLSRLDVDKELVPVLPITSNVIELMATLREPDSGKAMRTVPVRYQLVALDPDDTREKQLLRGAVPKAFNGVYGMTQTPHTVSGLVRTERFFGVAPEPVFQEQTTVPAAQPSSQSTPPPAASVSVDVQGAGEPKVISCTIC